MPPQPVNDKKSFTLKCLHKQSKQGGKTSKETKHMKWHTEGKLFANAFPIPV